jgi:tetratricopeptide (TPR) repeat protein
MDSPTPGRVVSADGAAASSGAPPLEALEEAVHLTRGRQYIRALELFEDHLGSLRMSDAAKAVHRFQSYYGLCLAMVNGQTGKALRLCENAVEACDPEADLFHNLGLVYLRNRRRDLAMLMFREGLRIDPSHPELGATLERMKRRRRPVLSFLPRRHPFNRRAGQLMSRFRRLLGGREPRPEV